MILIGLLAAVAGTAGFVMVVVGIHANERRARLSGPEAGHAEAFARRILGTYVQQPAFRSSR